MKYYKINEKDETKNSFEVKEILLRMSHKEKRLSQDENRTS